MDKKFPYYEEVFVYPLKSKDGTKFLGGGYSREAFRSVERMWGNHRPYFEEYGLRLLRVNNRDVLEINNEDDEVKLSRLLLEWS